MAESRIYRMHVLNRCNGFLEIEDWREFLLLDISKRKWSLDSFARGIRIKIPHQMVELNFLSHAHKTCSQHQAASVHTDPFFAANRIHVPAKVLPLPMSCHSQECFTTRPTVLTWRLLGYIGLLLPQLVGKRSSFDHYRRLSGVKVPPPLLQPNYDYYYETSHG